MRGLGLLALFLAAGCGVHLGDGYGRRTRAVLDAQANSKNEGAPISGDDAKGVMAKHMGRAGSTSPSGASGITSGTYGSSSSSQAQPIIVTPAATKPISLDAVR